MLRVPRRKEVPRDFLKGKIEKFTGKLERAKSAGNEEDSYGDTCSSVWKSTAIEQASRRWLGGRRDSRDDPARTRRKILITQVLVVLRQESKRLRHGRRQGLQGEGPLLRVRRRR